MVTDRLRPMGTFPRARVSIRPPQPTELVIVWELLALPEGTVLSCLGKKIRRTPVLNSSEPKGGLWGQPLNGRFMGLGIRVGVKTPAYPGILIFFTFFP